MAKGSHTQSVKAYLREQEKAQNSEVRHQIKANNFHSSNKSLAGGNRPIIRGH